MISKRSENEKKANENERPKREKPKEKRERELPSDHCLGGGGVGGSGPLGGAEEEKEERGEEVSKEEGGKVMDEAREEKTHATRFSREASVSFHPRVLSPQSGFWRRKERR